MAHRILQQEEFAVPQILRPLDEPNWQAKYYQCHKLLQKIFAEIACRNPLKSVSWSWMNQDSDTLQPFSGSVDELLAFSMTLFPDEVERQVEQANYEANIQKIMQMFECTFEEAECLFEEAKKNFIKNQLDVLIAEGKVKIVGTNEDGETLYTAVWGSCKKFLRFLWVCAIIYGQLRTTYGPEH